MGINKVLNIKKKGWDIEIKFKQGFFDKPYIKVKLYLKSEEILKGFEEPIIEEEYCSVLLDLRTGEIYPQYSDVKEWVKELIRNEWNKLKEGSL